MEERSKSLENEIKGPPVTFFDIDNTLVDGFSVFFFSDYLVSAGLFDKKAREEMQEDLKRYRTGQTDYRQFAIEVVDHYSLGLKLQREVDILYAGRKFLPSYKNKLFPYARKLITIMKGKGRLVVVSGAPKEAFTPLAKELGIDETHLLEAKAENGIYTGRTKINMALDEEKRKVIQGLGKFDYQRSFAFGDSIHDLPLLEAVNSPFVVGDSDKDLLKIAREKSWARVNGDNILETVRKI